MILLLELRIIRYKYHPPCNVEIKLTLSPASTTHYYLSASSQSTSFTNTKIPGRLCYDIGTFYH